jgi:hypothetical protein
LCLGHGFHFRQDLDNLLGVRVLPATDDVLKSPEGIRTTAVAADHERLFKQPAASNAQKCGWVTDHPQKASGQLAGTGHSSSSKGIMLELDGSHIKLELNWSAVNGIRRYAQPPLHKSRHLTDAF